MKFTLFQIIAFLIVSTNSVLSQQDTLVDVFPLSLGNRWTYRYDSYHWDEEGFTITDTGSATCLIVDKVTYPDSTIWIFEERRNLIHDSIYFGGPGIISYPINDSTIFTMTELRQGRHRLYRPVYTPYDPYALWSAVFPFMPDLTDTTMIFRYMPVDSADIASFDTHREEQYPGISFHFTLKKNVGEVGVSCQPKNLTGIILTTNHALKSFFLTSVQDSKYWNVPDFILYQNYPNPFNPATTITYSLSQHTRVSLKLFDVAGCEVRTMVEGFQPAGPHKVEFNANGLSTGTYFYRLTTSEFSTAKKLMFIK